MGRIIDVNNDRKDLVWSVTLKVGERARNENLKKKTTANLSNPLAKSYCYSRVIIEWIVISKNELGSPWRSSPKVFKNNLLS